jgi:hypothetical protein
MNALTGVPFFSDPYDAKPAPFMPIPMMAASVRILPATFAPSPPMLSRRISKNPRSFFTGSISAALLLVMIFLPLFPGFSFHSLPELGPRRQDGNRSDDSVRMPIR